MRYYALFIFLLANWLFALPCRAVSSLDFDRGNGTVFTDQFTGAIGGANPEPEPHHLSWLLVHLSA